jgi:hypothetical protein
MAAPCRATVEIVEKLGRDRMAWAQPVSRKLCTHDILHVGDMLHSSISRRAMLHAGGCNHRYVPKVFQTASTPVPRQKRLHVKTLSSNSHCLPPAHAPFSRDPTLTVSPTPQTTGIHASNAVASPSRMSVMRAPTWSSTASVHFVVCSVRREGLAAGGAGAGAGAKAGITARGCGERGRCVTRRAWLYNFGISLFLF